MSVLTKDEKNALSDILDSRVHPPVAYAIIESIIKSHGGK